MDYNRRVIRKLTWVLVVLLAACAPQATPSPSVAQTQPVVTVATFTPPPSPTVVPTPIADAALVGASGSVVEATPAVAPEVASAEDYCVDQINAQRAAAGLPPLNHNPTLMAIAEARVADMVARHYTGHYDPMTGEGLGKKMMREAGFTSGFMGENWYGSGAGPFEIVDVAMAWFMSDEPHAQNILHTAYNSAGCGIAFNGEQWLLVQNFSG